MPDASTPASMPATADASTPASMPATADASTPAPPVGAPPITTMPLPPVDAPGATMPLPPVDAPGATMPLPPDDAPPTTTMPLPPVDAPPTTTMLLPPVDAPGATMPLPPDDAPPPYPNQLVQRTSQSPPPTKEAPIDLSDINEFAEEGERFSLNQPPEPEVDDAHSSAFAIEGHPHEPIHSIWTKKRYVVIIVIIVMLALGLIAWLGWTRSRRAREKYPVPPIQQPPPSQSPPSQSPPSQSPPSQSPPDTTSHDPTSVKLNIAWESSNEPTDNDRVILFDTSGSGRSWQCCASKLFEGGKREVRVYLPPGEYGVRTIHKNGRQQVCSTTVTKRVAFTESGTECSDQVYDAHEVSVVEFCDATST